MKVLAHPRVTPLIAWAKRPSVQRALKLGIFALIGVFVIRSLSAGWSDIAHHTWHVNWPLLFLGGVLLIGQELTYGFIWQTILRRLGFALPWRASLRIYLAAEFVRYIPGNVWHVMTRVIWAERAGIPKPYGLASMIIELAAKIAAAALAFALSLFWWPRLGALGQAGNVLSLTLALVGVPLLVVGLHPRILRWGLNRALALLKRAPITLSLTYQDILVTTSAWIGSWIIGGLGFWLVICGVLPHAFSPAALPISIGIYALGWDIGFLSFVTPSGLFFREGAIALLLALAGIVPDLALAGIIAVLAGRVLPTLAEVLCVGWAYLANRSRA